MKSNQTLKLNGTKTNIIASEKGQPLYRKKERNKQKQPVLNLAIVWRCSLYQQCKMCLSSHLEGHINNVVHPCVQRTVFNKTKETFGGLHIVLNNAGIGDEKNWRKTIDVNLVSFTANLCFTDSLGWWPMCPSHGPSSRTIMCCV